MLDPSNSQLGSGGGGSSMFNPDQFNKKNVILLYWRELLMHLIIYRLALNVCIRI
jgi:hypothetical protein